MPKLRKDCQNSSGVDEDLEFLEGGKSLCHRHPKSLKDCSYREKEIKVVRSLCKELTGKKLQSDLNKFEPSNGLLNRTVICKADMVKLKFQSPLSFISPYNFNSKEYQHEKDMIGEQTEISDNSGDNSNSSASVVAFNLNWRKGVKVEQVSKYSKQTKFVEPELTTTDFDFESKLKFSRQLESQINDLFPNNNVKVLDGNECHGRVITTLKSKEVEAQFYNINPATYTCSTSGQLIVSTSPADIYEDKEEHKILLVPIHSKNGFDSDISKRYSFPYHANFTIDKKNYQHDFVLRLLPSRSPQHFGLVFTFPIILNEKNQQRKTNKNANTTHYITVKSLLSVYSVFPSTSKHAFLVTYSNNNEAEVATTSQNKRRGYKGQFVKNVQETVSANLDDHNLVNGSAFKDWDRSGDFSIGCSIAHPHQRLLGIQSRTWWDSKERSNAKHKEKVNITKSIKYDTVHREDEKIYSSGCEQCSNDGLIFISYQARLE